MKKKITVVIMALATLLSARAAAFTVWVTAPRRSAWAARASMSGFT